VALKGEVFTFTAAQLLAGALALITATAGSTFAIVRLATESHSSALQLQAAQLDTRVRELQAEIQRRQLVTVPAASNSTEPPPDAGLSVALRSPQAESEVPQFIDVRYDVRGPMPAGYNALLIVKDPLGQYWSFGSSQTGVQSQVQIGLASDEGRRFEVGVLITREKVPTNRPLTTLPSALIYESVHVKRRSR
jgi:hypothetical protein